MGIAVDTLIASLLPALNAGSIADLTFWTEAELYEFADEAVKQLARNAGVFIAEDTYAAAGSVALRANHVSAIAAYVDGIALREVSVRELEALDETWETTADDIAKKYTMTGLDTLRLYPAPASGVLSLIENKLPADIAIANPALAAPPPIAGLLAMSILGAARAKEGDAAMPEVASHCAERISLYGRVLAALYGGA